MPWERERAAEDIKLTTSNLQRELANGYFGGQQTAVNQARGTLEMIDTLTDNLVRGLPDGAAQPDGALVETIANGLTAGLENAGEVGYTGDEGEFEMPNCRSAVTPGEKFTSYSLDYDNPKAAGKAEAYEKGLGYTKDNADGLIKQIHTAVTLDNVKPYAMEETQYGVKYKYRIPVTGPNGKTKAVIAVYQMDLGSTTPRLITNYLEGK